MLYVNPTFGRYVEVAAGQPMEEAESDALLQDLYHQCQCLQTFPFGLSAHQTESRVYHEGKAKDSDVKIVAIARVSAGDFPEYQCYFTYDSGSMAFWDNRACMHRASVDFSPHERIMRRVTIQGSSAPFYDPLAAAAAVAAVQATQEQHSGGAAKL